MKTKLLVSAIAAAFILSACGKKTEAPAPSSTDNSMATAPATTETPASDAMAASAAASEAASDASEAASSASSPPQ